MTYSGWVIFAGTSGGHNSTDLSNKVLISGFEEVTELKENHFEKKFNLLALLCKKEESVYDV
jgi:hypothetical protein